MLTEARERGDRWGEGMMLLLMAGVRLWSGFATAGLVAAEDALTVFRGIGDRFGEPRPWRPSVAAPSRSAASTTGSAR